MGRCKAWALAWLLAATLSALFLQALSAGGEELLVNGGFEDGTAPWVPKGGTLQIVEDLGQNGSVAGVFSVDSTHQHRVEQCVPAFGEVDYQFSGWVVWPGEGQAPSAYLRVSWYGQADCYGDKVDPLDDSGTVTLVNAGSWYYLTVEADTPVAATRSARLSMVVLGDATVYLDDFSFSGPAAPSPTPSPSPPATQTPSPTASPSPSPRPIASPTLTPVASPSPTAVPTATEVPSTSTPSIRLVNAGFEEADGEGRPLGWRKYGGELRQSAAAKREGWFAAAFTSRTASTKWAFQTVAVEGGEAYVLSGYALKNDANVQGAYLRLSWYASLDGSGRAIDSVDSTARLTDDSPDFRFLTTGPVEAPSEAVSAKVRLMLDPFSEAEGKVYFDDISFEETVMPPPTQTAVPSPLAAATQTPPALPSDATQRLALPAATPTPPAEDSQAASSPSAFSPSPTVLGATLNDSKAASSRDGLSQREAGPEGTPSRTPVFLYRERRAAQPAQAEQGVVAAAGEGGGPWVTALVLGMVVPAATAAAAAFFVWRQWKKRARSP